MKDLIEILEMQSIPIGEILFAEEIDYSNLQGSLAEYYVREKLLRAEVSLDTHLPGTKLYGYHFKTKGMNMNVTLYGKQSVPVAEYDFIGFYDGNPVVMEVKSGSLKGLQLVVDRFMKPINEIFSKEVPLLLFSPYNRAVREKIEGELRSNYPSSHVLYLGCDKKELTEEVDKRLKNKVKKF